MYIDMVSVSLRRVSERPTWRVRMLPVHCHRHVHRKSILGGFAANTVLFTHASRLPMALNGKHFVASSSSLQGAGSLVALIRGKLDVQERVLGGFVETTGISYDMFEFLR